jgi:transcriptional regulator with XRE-family HTH domain
MTEEVNLIRGNDRISQLAQRPDIAAGVAQIRADMAEADRTYPMGLAALRQAAELTQVELARRMGVTQAAISRMEQPHDLLLSTLNAYLQAIGGTARMIVSFADGHEATLDLSQLALPPDTRTGSSPWRHTWRRTYTDLGFSQVFTFARARFAGLRAGCGLFVPGLSAPISFAVPPAAPLTCADEFPAGTSSSR